MDNEREMWQKIDSVSSGSYKIGTGNKGESIRIDRVNKKEITVLSWTDDNRIDSQVAEIELKQGELRTLGGRKDLDHLCEEVNRLSRMSGLPEEYQHYIRAVVGAYNDEEALRTRG